MATDPESISLTANNFHLYTQLNRDSKQIRLLTLLAGDYDETLCCTIKIESLTETSIPRYESLSYCWGNVNETEKITVRHVPHAGETEEQDFTVTANLASALRRIRLPDQARTLWIDAICINQHDTLERNHQVTLMRNIYKSAERTLIWLGEDDGTVETALDLATRIVRMMTRLDQPNGLQNEQDQANNAQEIAGSLNDFGQPGALVSQLEKLPPVDSGSWKALARLFSRSWFTRIWVVQEVVASQEATVLCGESSIDWVVIQLTAAWLSRNNLLAQTGEEGFRSADNVMLMFGFLKPDHRKNGGMSPLALLWMLKDHDATDQRDKVFASLGLMFDKALLSNLPPALRPDYTKTTETVYRDLALHVIRKDRNLDALSLVQPHRASIKVPEALHSGARAHHHLEHLPTPAKFASWIPRWEYGFGGGNSGPLGLFPDPSPGTRPLYNASGALPLQPITLRHHTDPKSLAVRGQNLDRITSISEPIWANYLDLDLPADPVHGHLARSSSNPLRQAWDTHRNQLLEYPTSEDAATVLRLLFVANRSRMKTRADGDPTSESDFFAYVRAVGLDKQDFPDTYNKRSVDLARGGDARKYSRDLVHSCSARSVFATSLGYLGLCHFDVEVGDVVVMLFGGKVLYILRPNGRTWNEKQTWTFLGEAYLHGLMDGEALTMIRGFQDPSEIFDLR